MRIASRCCMHPSTCAIPRRQRHMQPHFRATHAFCVVQVDCCAFVHSSRGLRLGGSVLALSGAAAAAIH